MRIDSEAAPPRTEAGGWNRRVLRLALPFILSNLSVPLLGAVDTAVMGHQPDPAYLGAVAVGATIFSVVYWGFGFLRMGTTAFTAQAAGAGDQEELRHALARPVLIGLALGLAIIALQLPIGWAAFTLIGPSDAVRDLGLVYFDIRVWGAPATLITYALFGWLRGIEKPGAVLLLTLVLNGGNIALTLFLVLELEMGIAGAAYGTVIAEYAALALGFFLVSRQLPKGPAWLWRRIAEKARMMALFRVNRDILIRTLCLEAAFVTFMQQSAQFGDSQLAANAILLQFQTFMAYGLDGFSDAAEILAASAYGRRSRGAFFGAVRAASAWAVGLSLLVAFVYWLAGERIIALFTDLGGVREAAALFLPWLVLSPVVSVWSFLLDGIFIGTTHSAEMRNAMIASLLTFLAGAALLVPTLGNHGLWLAFLIFMAARALTLGAMVPRILRKLS